MATIQDIFDWLNQGAQGDIPGTGGEQPNTGAASQGAQGLPATSQAGGGEAGAVTPGAFYAGGQASPGEYTGDIHPSLLPQYQHLVQSGVPPDVAHHMLTQPSLGEGETPPGGWQQHHPYAGLAREQAASQAAPQRDEALSQHMWDKRFYEGMNQPTQEGQVQGPGDNFGYLQLPTGQYVPTSPSAQPSDLLSWYQSQGNPQSFWWNPAQGSGWASLLGGQ